MQELDLLKPENTVYKMVGPVLVPQEQGEAKANVEKRLEFIKSDTCVPSPFLFLSPSLPFSFSTSLFPASRIDVALGRAGNG